MIARVEIDVLVEADGWDDSLPGGAEAFAQKVLGAAGKAEKAMGAVSVLLTGDSAIQALNRDFRGKNKPTNVLSFPAPKGPGGQGMLGDVALGLGVVQAEALAQGKTVEVHTAHLLVHGFLHLIGHDHEAEEAAEAMETRERAILAGLGYGDPYAAAGGAE
ncbi:MAG: rRNA maturation RNase YbeY [Caulobacterales bacterium]|jgi:probable rRNA maturation factor